MKIYAISILAFSPLHDADTKTENTYVEQIPAIVPAESIAHAARNARDYAYQRWNPNDGWYGHQATVMSVTKEFYEAAGRALNDGLIDWTPDEGQCFTLADL